MHETLLAIAIAALVILISLYRANLRQTREDAIIQKRADRAADAADRVGGYDELIEIERQRRRGTGP